VKSCSEFHNMIADCGFLIADYDSAIRIQSEISNPKSEILILSSNPIHYILKYLLFEGFIMQLMIPAIPYS
jgi:hypothetical protein